MITIEHQMYFNKGRKLSRLLTDFKVRIDMEILDNDIKEYKDKIKNEKLKVLHLIYKESLGKLEKLKRIASENDGEFDMCWIQDKEENNITYPVRLEMDKIAELDLTKYVCVEPNEKLITIKLDRVADTIAYYMTFKEDGTTTEEIEEKLSKCLINSPNPTECLDAIVCNNWYTIARTYLIDNSPMKDIIKNKINDYFMTKSFDICVERTIAGKKVKDRSYKDVIDYSCMLAAEEIAYAVISKLIKDKIKYRVIGLNTTEIAICVESEDTERLKEIASLDGIVVMIFGRLFEIDNYYSVV